MSYSGSCHCGKIAYTVDGDIDQVMACNCSICSRRGYLLWFVPRSALHVSTPESDIATYTFNKHAIRHQFCATCGCAPFGIGADGTGNEMAAINARCLEGVEPSSLKTVQYDGRAV